MIATAFHRPTTREEMIFKLGDKMVREEKIINHDCRDQSALVRLGMLPSDGELMLIRLAVEADLLVAEGFSEPHFFAGYSGGRKSILPGVAGEQTALDIHCSKFLASERSRTGILEGNPMHLDIGHRPVCPRLDNRHDDAARVHLRGGFGRSGPEASLPVIPDGVLVVVK